MAKVFISYSHDSEVHKRRVRELAERLRAHQLEVLIDQDMLPGGQMKDGTTGAKLKCEPPTKF